MQDSVVLSQPVNPVNLPLNIVTEAIKAAVITAAADVACCCFCCCCYCP